MSMTRGTVGGSTKSPRRFNRLARIVARAMLMLGVGSVPSQAASITHNFSDAALVQDYNFSTVAPFNPYTFRVGFDDVLPPSGFSLTITDNQVEFPGPTHPLGPGYQCVQMTLLSSCVGFEASGVGGPLPQRGSEFSGNITIGISYGVFGWPLSGDPVDIGLTDNFSTFMIFATANPYQYRVVHYPATGEASDISIAHCGGTGNINTCAQLNNLPNFVVPEAGSVTGVAGAVWGLFGLTVLSRRLKRRA